MTNSWNVDFIERTHGRTSWAACVAMLLNHRDSTSLTDGDVASQAGVEPHGTVASDDDHPAILEHFFLTETGYYTPSPREWDDLLNRGPVIAALNDRVVVVGSVNGETDPQDCQLHVMDPVYGAGWLFYSDLSSNLGFHQGTELRIVQS